MAKFLFLLIFFALAPQSWAAPRGEITDVQLQKEYGYDLTKAPFFLRFSYFRQFGKDWKETDYTEREAFLKDYDTNAAIERAKDMADAKAEAAEEKALAREKRQELKDQLAQLKAEEQEEKAEEKEQEDRDKDFNKAVEQEEKEISQVQRDEIEHRNMGGSGASPSDPDQTSDQGSSY